MDATRDNNFTDKQKRGIDLICKSLMKKYTFIYDWEMDEGWEKWATYLYINLYVDIKKLSEFFNLPIHPHYQKLLDSGDKIRSSSILLLPLLPGEFGSPDREKYSDLSYNTRREMDVTANTLYENFPENMLIKWKGRYGEYVCNIQIDEFIFTSNE